MPDTASRTSLDDLDIPPDLRAALISLRDDLQREVGTDLAALVLYGGVARGRYRPGKSDINIAVVLHSAAVESLRRAAPALRAGWRARRVEPFIVTPAEIPRLAVAFPTKLLDIARCHIVLTGSDPFAGINVPHEKIRERIEQSLRNIELRLRRRYISIFDDPASLAETLSETAASLKVEFGALLQLAGKEEADGATTAQVLEAAASAFGFDGSTLARMAALRRPAESSPAAPEELSALYDRTLAAIASAIEFVAVMQTGD